MQKQSSMQADQPAPSKTTTVMQLPAEGLVSNRILASCKKKGIQGVLDISTSTLKRHYQAGKIPGPTHYIGGRPHWSVSVIRHYLETGEV